MEKHVYDLKKTKYVQLQIKEKVKRLKICLRKYIHIHNINIYYTI